MSIVVLKRKANSLLYNKQNSQGLEGFSLKGHLRYPSYIGQGNRGRHLLRSLAGKHGDLHGYGSKGASSAAYSAAVPYCDSLTEHCTSDCFTVSPQSSLPASATFRRHFPANQVAVNAPPAIQMSTKQKQMYKNNPCGVVCVEQPLT
jgi:hypothetical protein